MSFRCNLHKSIYNNSLSYLKLMNVSHCRLISDVITTFTIPKYLADIENSSLSTTYSTSNLEPLIKIREYKFIYQP